MLTCFMELHFLFSSRLRLRLKDIAFDIFSFSISFFEGGGAGGHGVWGRAKERLNGHFGICNVLKHHTT